MSNLVVIPGKMEDINKILNKDIKGIILGVKYLSIYPLELDIDSIIDIKNNTERVIYKSLKGAVIMIDDYDSEEYIKIIDQSGQEIMMQNYDVPLDRRGSDLGVSNKSKITITNNHGDVITLKNDKTYIKSKSLIIESEELDMPGLNRDFSQEAALQTDILRENAVKCSEQGGKRTLFPPPRY